MIRCVPPADGRGRYRRPRGHAGEVDRLVGWFTCHFSRGGHTVVLDTGPSAKATHWHQMVFHLSDPVKYRKGDKLATHLTLRTAGGFHREMNVKLAYQIVGAITKPEPKSKDYTVVIVPDTTRWNA